MMILSIALVGLLRGFIVSMEAMRDIRITTTASLLAESLLEDYELEPPLEGSEDGSFLDDSRFGEPFVDYRWEREVEEIEPDYDEIPRSPLQDEEPIYRMDLRIIYDSEQLRDPVVPIQITTYLMQPQIFSDDAVRSNQLF